MLNHATNHTQSRCGAFAERTEKQINIVKAEIISQPYSGEYKERIYDLESPWNSQFWTWIKFADDFGNETVGQFRGSPVAVKVSGKLNEIIVLTSDYVYRLESKELNIIEVKDEFIYQDVEISPNGIFIFHNYYEIEKMGNSFSEMEEIKSPFKMDDIKFIKWNNNKLEFTCEEFINWNRVEIMELDTNKWEIIKKTTPQHRV